MHLHVKHQGLGDKPHNLAVDHLMLMEINLLITQLKNDVKYS